MRCLISLCCLGVAHALSAGVTGPRSLHHVPSCDANTAQHIVRVGTSRPAMAMTGRQLRAPSMPEAAGAFRRSNPETSTAVDMSVAQTTINLVKAIVGAGALTPGRRAFMLIAAPACLEFGCRVWRARAVAKRQA